MLRFFNRIRFCEIIQSDHNNKKGAKATKGHNWKLIFKKKFYSKSKAMSYEYKIKKDRLLRKKFQYSE